MTSRDLPQIWIGLFHFLQDLSFPLGIDIGGAYARIAARATTVSEFFELVDEALLEEGFYKVETFDVVEVSRISGVYELDSVDRKLIDAAVSGYPVQWDLFHTYPASDLPDSNYKMGDQADVLHPETLDFTTSCVKVCGWFCVETEGYASEYNTEVGSILYLVEDEEGMVAVCSESDMHRR